MSDSSARARLVAAKAGQLSGSKTEQRTRAWLRFLAAQGKVHSVVAIDNLALPVDALDEMLFNLTVLYALNGQDIVDAVTSMVSKREMGIRTPVPGTAAPIPDEGGMLVDPANGKAARVDS